MTFSRTLRRRSLLVFGLALLSLSTAASLPRAMVSVSAQQADASSYDELIGAGRKFMTSRRYEEALKAFKRANDLKGQASTEALFEMANAYMGLEAYKTVAITCDKVIELAANDSAMQAQAYNLKGIAIQKQSEGKDQKKLQEAEGIFRQAAALKPAKSMWRCRSAPGNPCLWVDAERSNSIILSSATI